MVPNIWGRLLGRLARVPAIVGNCRGGGAPRRQHERWLWPLAQHIVCNSAALKRVLTRQLRRARSRGSASSSTGWTRIIFSRPPEAGPYPAVVALGGPDGAGQGPRHPDPGLCRGGAGFSPRRSCGWSGRGPLLGNLQQLAGELLPPGACRFIPPQADLRPLFQQAGLLALSSRTEALPNVVLEAMAAGLPVAATAVGGVPELVTPARTGWLAPPGDPPALAAALGRLLANPEQCRDFGRAARRRVLQDFSLDAMVSRYEEVLRAALSRAAR